MTAELSAPRPIPQAVSEVPVGLPSELLERRPDVRAAERRIAAANARIGIAQADLYPHFSLTAVTGLESLYFSSFSSASSGYYSDRTGHQLADFRRRRIRFQVRAESARTDAAAAAYERSVLNAFRDRKRPLPMQTKNTPQQPRGRIRRRRPSHGNREASLRERPQELPAGTRCGTLIVCSGRSAGPK